MLNRIYFGRFFFVLGILLVFFLILFGQELFELWQYGVIYLAILMIFMPFIYHGQKIEFTKAQNLMENEQGENKQSTQTLKRKSLGSETFPVLLFVFLFCIFCIGLFLPTPLEFIRDQDWAHQLAGANQILKGEHPFITFLDFYGPLTFYSSALAQFIFNTRVIGEIILITLGYSAAYTIIFWLMWSLCQDRSLSLILLAILIILVPKLYKYYIVIGPALTLLFAWLYLDNPSHKRLWLVGLAVVLTGLFRPDFGAYMTISATTAIFLQSSKKFTLKQKLWNISYFGIILIVLASPWLIFVTVGGGLRDYLYYSTIGGVVTGSGMSLPLSFSNDLLSIQNLESLVIVAFNLIPSYALISVLRQRPTLDSQNFSKLVVLIVVSQLTLIQGWHRTGWEHFLQAIPMTFILLAYLFKNAQLSFWSKSRFSSLISLGLGIGLLSSMLISRLPDLGRISITRTFDDLKVFSLERDQFTELLIKQYPNSPLLGAMNYIRTCTKPNDKIIAWPYLIDFYYFTDRPLGGRLKAVAPIFSGPDEEEAIVRNMESDDIAYFVFLPHEFNPTIPNIQDYAPAISKHLDESYIPIQNYGRITININRNRQPPIDCYVR